MMIHFLRVLILYHVLTCLLALDRWSMSSYNGNGLWENQHKTRVDEVSVETEQMDRMPSSSSNMQQSRATSLKFSTKSLIPIPGISSIKICGENSLLGINICRENCVSKIINCVGRYCFCNCRRETMESKTRVVNENIDPNAHVCGENTDTGILSCRETCSNAKDFILCVSHFCYCNINVEEVDATAFHLTQNAQDVQQSSKYDVSKVLSSWKCNMMKVDGVLVAGLKQCFYECASMKSSVGMKSSKTAVMLTCNTQNKNCACITFKPISEVEKSKELNSQKIKIPTLRKLGSCRGYACFIENVSTVKPLNIDRPVHNFIFCGPNHELGFTKCRDMCRFEKRGVVRCAGHSCYCHYGGVPFVLERIVEHGNQESSIGAPFQSRFTPCGKTKEKCQSICQFIGDVVCGSLGCYCDSGL